METLREFFELISTYPFTTIFVTIVLYGIFELIIKTVGKIATRKD